MNLIELQHRHIKELREAIKKPIDLLTAAKYAAGNYISDCSIEGCKPGNRCNSCKEWSKVWDDIDEYLNDNDPPYLTMHNSTHEDQL